MTTILTLAVIAVFILLFKTRSELKRLRMLTDAESSVLWDTLLRNEIIDYTDYENARDKGIDIMREKLDPEKFRKEREQERAELIKKYQLDKPTEERINS